MAGYLGSRPVVVQVDGYQREESEARYVNVSGDDFSGHLDFVDDAKARFGSSDELHIYTESSGSGHSYIQGDNIVIRSAAGTARLTVTSNDVDVSSGALKVGGTTVIDSSRNATFTTVTSDGLTTDSISNSSGNLSVNTTQSFAITFDSNNDQTNREFNLMHDNGVKIITADENGDIKFYEDTGTTAKFFWDASAERLGLGTSSPNKLMHLKANSPVINLHSDNASSAQISFTNSGGVSEQGFIKYEHSGDYAGSMQFRTSGSEAMRITSDGKLKLRTSDNLGNINTHPTYNTEGAYVNGFLNGGGAGPYPRYLDLAAVGDSSWGGIIRFLSNDNSNNTAVERMRVDASGKVGIGIAPVSQLTVKGAGANGTIKVIPDAVNAEASIGFYQDTTGANQTSRWVAGVGGWGQTNQFVIGTGSSPKLKIDTTGRVSKPYQPGFYAYSTGFSKSTGWQNVSQYMTSTGHNVGNHYTTTGGNTGRFTAPVTGRYVFHAGGWSSHNGGTNCQRYMYSIYVNNGNIGNGAGGNYSNGDTPMENGSFIVQLTAGQWVHLNAFSHVACTWGGNTHHFHWSGYLLG